MKTLLLPLFIVAVCLVGDTSTRAITATTTTIASQLGNISTRGFVQTGDNILDGGFIIQGTTPKTVIVRAIGPALAQYGLDALADPTLELHAAGNPNPIAFNDNWQSTVIGGVITQDQVQAIRDSGHVPTQPSESAIIATLQPGNYTAIVSGVSNTIGVALVEVFDLSPSTTSVLGNISTRGFVETGDNILDGGFIIQGITPKTVIVRAIGPELTQYGLNALADPTLELHAAGNPNPIASNDNWQTTVIGGIITTNQVSDIQNSGWAPGDAREPAIVATVQPGLYTAIVRGKNNTTGVALVEVYDLDAHTFETVTQRVSASQGGTVTLPSGSSASFPGGVLPSDQLVTLSLLSKLPTQPPNGLIIGVGPALSMSFAPVNAAETALISAPGSVAERAALLPSGTPPTIEVVLNLAGSTEDRLDGAAPIGAYASSNLDSFGPSLLWYGPPGQIIAHERATFTIEPTVFSVAYGTTISAFRFVFTPGNLNPNLANVVTPGGKFWDGSSWHPFPTNGLPPGWNRNLKTLCLVHGVNSSIEDAFRCVNAIKMAGGYAQVVGFDYQWPQDLDTSGQQLAGFINSISWQRPGGLTKIDLEGHSEGGAVVVSAGSKITSPGLRIDNIVTLGGAEMGTPLANSAPSKVTFLLMTNPFTAPLPFFPGTTLGSLLNTPAFRDLQLNSPALRAMVMAYNQNSARDCTSILPVAGNVPMPGTEILWPIFHPERYDGIIGENEALLLGSSLNHVQQGRSFAHYHTALECAGDVVSWVGSFIHNSVCSPLTGTWIGTWAWSGPGSNGCMFNDGGNFSMTLTQTGTSYSGSTYGEGIETRDAANGCVLVSVDPGTGTMSGSISGTSLNFSFDLDVLEFINGTATLDNNTNTITATFVRTTGGSGSFTATRR